MDFSHWGEPSPEWLSFAAANASLLALSDEHLPPLYQQRNANKTRTNLAKHLVQTSGIGHLVATKDHAVPTRDGQSINVRSYRPKLLGSRALPAYVYFHGGGFIFGTPDTELFNCSFLAHSLNITVLHVCYRHTPHVKGLTPWHDAIDGFEWIASHTHMLGINPSHIVVGGISAGGSLTASVVQHEVRRAREAGTPSRIRGQVLGIPTLIHYKAFPYDLFASKEKTSILQNSNAAMLPDKRMRYFSDLLGSEVDPTDRTWSPGLAEEEELKDIPPTAILVAGWDPLRDEALLYARKLKNAGVRTRVHIFPGLPHVFYAFKQLPSHARWNEVMHSSLRWANAGDDGWVVEELPMMPSFTAPTTSSSDPVTAGAVKSDPVPEGATSL
ncbi:hypothetical protein M426DRAFT_323300 [Hypoxylon sp. CI-4A]|nr:hypothetical protein M426DRAFT_323300 [Hypoxylon sp. CI-4A]